MKSLVALSGALVATLMLAAPAVADQKVLVAHWEWGTGPDNPYEVPVTTADWGFECVDPIWQGAYDGHANVWLWFEKGVDPNDPDAPWTHGMWVEEDIDYFSSEPNMGGIVVWGRTHVRRQMSDLDTSVDPHTWRENWTGNVFTVQAPRVGTHIYTVHFAGLKVTAWEDPPGSTIFHHDWENAVGNFWQHIDAEAVCAALGTEVK